MESTKAILSENDLLRIAGSLLKFSNLLSLFHSEYAHQTKEKIIRNFVFRGATLLESIITLRSIKHFQDGSVLFRCQLDRLVHLHYLNKNDQFKEFDDWCSVNEYEANHRALSDTYFKERIQKNYFKPTDSQRKRYRTIKEAIAKWKKPRPKDVLEEMGMKFLY